MRRAVVALGVSFALVGCTPGSIRPLPTTPEGCVADYDAGKQRLRSAPVYHSGPNIGASLLGAAVGRGLSAGALESRYNACLAQFGSTGVITDANTYRATTTPSRTTTTIVASQTPGSEKAMEACVAGAGITGTYGMLPPAARGASYTVLAGDNVTDKQAGAINTCIAKGAPVKRVSQVAAPYQDRNDYVPELGPDYNAYDCGTAVFVGGSGYCIRGAQ